MKRIVTIVMAFCMVFSLAACGASKETSEGNSESTEAAKEPANVALCENWDFESGFFTPLHPGNSAGGHGVSYYLPNMYETLVVVKDGKITPSLAETWEVSEDGLTYTFHLKENIRFSDGSGFNAEVVKLNLDALPGIMGQYNGMFGLTSSIIKSTEAKDEYTVVLHLTRPYYGVLNDMAMMSPMGMMSANAYKEDMTLSDATLTTSFGTGPYMYTGDYDGTTYTFVRNPHYHGEKPDADSFTVTVITDSSAAELALRSDEIDMLWGTHAVSYDAMAEFGNNNQFKTQLDERVENVQYLAFNTTKAPFDDVTVRNAVAMAIDKESLCETVYGGLVSETNRLFPKYYPYCGMDAEGKGYDLEEAKRLLKEAGYADTDEDGILEKAGQPLSVTMPYIAENSTSDNAMLFIADQLTAVGIEVKVSGMDQMSWFGSLMQGDWGLSFYHTYTPSYDPYTIMSNMDIEMQADPCAWQVSLVLPDGDKIFKELNLCTDQERIQEIYDYVLESIYSQSIMVPIYEKYPPAIFNTNKIMSVDMGDSVYSDTVDVSKIKLK